jgi:hypothetical protein
MTHSQKQQAKKIQKTFTKISNSRARCKPTTVSATISERGEDFKHIYLVWLTVQQLQRPAVREIRFYTVCCTLHIPIVGKYSPK